MSTIKRSEVEAAQRELNAILGREESPEEFDHSVDARLSLAKARVLERERIKAERKTATTATRRLVRALAP